MFKMTFNEALLIQRAQMAYYRRAIGRKGCQAIRKATIFPIDIQPDEPMDVIEINRLVPRGGDFESKIFYWPSSHYDPTQGAMHDAIRRGLL